MSTSRLPAARFVAFVDILGFRDLLDEMTQDVGLYTLCRGGVSRGWTVHADGVAFGEGVVSAYELESRVAVFPRIIVSDELKFLSSGLAKLRRDADYALYLDPYATPMSRDEREAGMFEARGALDRRLRRELTTKRRPGVLSKIRWAVERFNEAVEALPPSIGPIELIELESRRRRSESARPRRVARTSSIEGVGVTCDGGQLRRRRFLQPGNDPEAPRTLGRRRT